MGLILLRKRPPGAPSALHPCEDTMKTPPPTKNRASPEPTILTPSSQMSGLQICRKRISVAEAPSLLFCYGSPSRLRQCVLLHLLLLLSIMCLRCICIVAVSELHSFSWLSHIPLCGWTPLCVSVLLSLVDGHLGGPWKLCCCAHACTGVWVYM